MCPKEADLYLGEDLTAALYTYIYIYQKNVVNITETSTKQCEDVRLVIKGKFNRRSIKRHLK